MSTLPEEFLSYTCSLMGEERFSRYLGSFEKEMPVSIRLNPRKTAGEPVGGTPVAWCQNGYYLSGRPQFTFDPLFHAGCYYVQEAASMFLSHVLSHILPSYSVSVLDLCAAPGGKSTLAASLLPAGSILISNDPVLPRAKVLSENMQKWGSGSCFVTSNFPADFGTMAQAKPHSRHGRGLSFDIIMADVPCSGEGMFRKDAAAISGWSQETVRRCSKLQRDIIADVWPCLRPGGYLIYSTCTLNAEENERNVRWIADALQAIPISIPVDSSWGITGSLLADIDIPVYRFIPGLTLSEGLFVAVLRKPKSSGVWESGGLGAKESVSQGLRESGSQDNSYVREKPMPSADVLKILTSNNMTVLPNDFLEVLSQATDAPLVNLDYRQAISFLRREAIVLSRETPLGIVAVGYQGHPLGVVKNIGTRANNLYPKEWRIKSTHIPQYEAVLRPS